MRLGRTGRRVLVLTALAAAVAAFLSVAAIRHGFFDLRIYHGAVTFWARDGGEIYDYLKPDSKYGYTYPPFAALLMLPMAYLSWPASIALSVAAAAVATGAVLWWLVDPIARREGWTRWFALAVTLCLAAAFEPMRETVNFGQVNALLLAVVAGDLLLLARRGSRWAGVGVGLATAVKLTPGIFLVYLLVTGRWRAAVTAAATAAGVTVLAGAVAPDASREFWTHALWNTDRVGSLSFVSNQSLQGVVARLDPGRLSTPLWLALVAAALVVWAVRCRRAIAADARAGTRDDTARDGAARDGAARDGAGPSGEATGLALTGIVGCLVSPVTWVHHLVWLLPALVLLVDHGMAAPPGSRRRRRLLGFAGFAYALLISRFVWIWEKGSGGVLGFLGGNAYVWVSVALLLALPLPEGTPPTPEDGDRRIADRERSPRSSIVDPRSG
jgi:alpha-1,2-mannosyltransferase